MKNILLFVVFSMSFVSFNSYSQSIDFPSKYEMAKVRLMGLAMIPIYLFTNEESSDLDYKLTHLAYRDAKLYLKSGRSTYYLYKYVKIVKMRSVNASKLSFGETTSLVVKNYEALDYIVSCERNCTNEPKVRDLLQNHRSFFNYQVRDDSILLSQNPELKIHLEDIKADENYKEHVGFKGLIF